MRFTVLPHVAAGTLTLVLAACSTTAQSAEPMPTDTTTATPEPTKSPTPEPTAATTPSPTPESVFENPQTCTNDSIGFTINYPGDWWANERVSAEEPVADVPGCLYFAPEPVTIEPGTDDFTGIAIRADLTADAETREEVLSSDEVSVAGREAMVRELQLAPQPGFVPEGALVYEYVIPHGEDWLVFAANNFHVDEATYEAAKQVLDAMVDTIEIPG